MANEQRLAPIWLVKMPIHSYYKETSAEAKDMARKAGVRIVNAQWGDAIGEQFLAKNPPKLTELGVEQEEPKPKPKAKAKAKTEGDDE